MSTAITAQGNQARSFRVFSTEEYSQFGSSLLELDPKATLEPKPDRLETDFWDGKTIVQTILDQKAVASALGIIFSRPELAKSVDINNQWDITPLRNSGDELSTKFLIEWKPPQAELPRPSTPTLKPKTEPDLLARSTIVLAESPEETNRRRLQAAKDAKQLVKDYIVAAGQMTDAAKEALDGVDWVAALEPIAKGAGLAATAFSGPLAVLFTAISATAEPAGKLLETFRSVQTAYDTAANSKTLQSTLESVAERFQSLKEAVLQAAGQQTGNAPTLTGIPPKGEESESDWVRVTIPEQKADQLV